MQQTATVVQHAPAGNSGNRVNNNGNGKTPPSLQGGFFIIGETDPLDMFVSAEFSEEQLMIREMVEEFCQKEFLQPFMERGRELQVTDPADLGEVIRMLEKAGELGLCGVGIEEAYGGLDLDFNTGLLFSEAVAVGHSFATTIGAHTSIGTLPIVYYGTEAQKARYLPGIASGALKAAYCLTEPTAGSDANAGTTQAILSADGLHYLLTGQKIWITNGGFADIFIVFAKIEKDDTLSAFIVEKAFGGITIGPEEKKLGIKGSSTVQLFFDNCPVPVENLLSGRQDGFKIALNILNTGRIKLGAGTVGAGKRAVTLAAKYAAERRQFGKSISQFGAIQHKIGEMTARTFAVDAALYRTGKNIDLKADLLSAQGKSASESKIEAVREFAIECAILKIKGSEIADYSIDEAMQIHGGMGYAVETGIEMGYRDARITRIYEGTNEINRMLSVGELTKRALKTKEIDIAAAGKRIPGNLLKQCLPFKSTAQFAVETRLVKGIKNVFLLIYAVAGKKLGKALIDEQEMVMNMADMLVEAYICDSVLLKVRKISQSGATDSTDLDIQRKLLSIYLYESRYLVMKAAFDAINAFAQGLLAGSLRLLVRCLLPPAGPNVKTLRRRVSDYVVSKGEYPFV